MYDFTQKYNQRDNDCLCQIIYIAICNAMVFCSILKKFCMLATTKRDRLW